MRFSLFSTVSLPSHRGKSICLRLPYSGTRFLNMKEKKPNKNTVVNTGQFLVICSRVYRYLPKYPFPSRQTSRASIYGARNRKTRRHSFDRFSIARGRIPFWECISRRAGFPSRLHSRARTRRGNSRERKKK